MRIVACMVSTVVHISVGLIIACAILPSRNFTFRSLALVGVIVALLDADAFLFFISDGLHRTVLHNLIFTTIITAVTAPTALAVGSRGTTRTC